MSEVPRAVAAGESATAQSGTAAPIRLRRFLKDVESAENEIIREALYNYPTTVEEKAFAAELAAGDIAQAKEARDKILGNAMRPIKEKMNDFRGFTKLLGQPQHSRVVGAFIITTCCMFTLPIIVLLTGIHLVAPALGMDPGTCGGFMALGTVVAIMAGYIVYAMLDSDLDHKGEEGKKDR